MLLVVPESWSKQVEILKSFGIGDLSALDKIEAMTPVKKEVKVEEQKEVIVRDNDAPEIIKEVIAPKEDETSEIVEVKPEETSEEDTIAMSNRKTCPVQIVPTKSAVKKVDVTNVGKVEKEEIDESRLRFEADLGAKGVIFEKTRRMDTGLIEVDLVNNNGDIVTISVDVEDKLYGLGGQVFFIGAMHPKEEYIKQPFLLTDDSLRSVLNNLQIDKKFYVPRNWIEMESMIDTDSIREANIEKKKEVLETAYKAVMIHLDTIKNTVGTEPFRFVFTRYKNANDFVIISSNKNRESNLGPDKILATREVKITVKDHDVKLNIK